MFRIGALRITNAPGGYVREETGQYRAMPPLERFKYTHALRHIRGGLMVKRSSDTVHIEFELVEGVHYARYADGILASLDVAHTFYPVLLGTHAETIPEVELEVNKGQHVVSGGTFPRVAFVVAPLGIRPAAHLHLPGAVPRLIVSNRNSFSHGTDGHPDAALIQELGKVYVEEMIPKKPTGLDSRNNWILVGHALHRAFARLAKPLMYQEYLMEWMTKLDWSEDSKFTFIQLNQKVAFERKMGHDRLADIHLLGALPLYGKEAKMAFVALHMLAQANEVFDGARLITTIEVLMAARQRQGYGWGKWFLRYEPRPCWYTATMAYKPATHEIDLEFEAPGFRGESIVVRIAEIGGITTDKVLAVRKGRAPQRFVLTLGEAKASGRSGRKPYNQEQRKKRWEKAGTKERVTALIHDYQFRKFWEIKHVRHVIIDPDGRGLLIPRQVTAPPSWWLEILDEVRFSANQNRIPLATQLTAVRELVRNAGDHDGMARRVLLMVIVGTAWVSNVVRVEIIVQLCAMEEMEPRDIQALWREYIEGMNRAQSETADWYQCVESRDVPPEPCIVEAFLENGTKRAGKDPLNERELLAELVVAVETYPDCAHLRPLVLRTIRQYPWPSEIPSVVILTEEALHVKLLDWARMELGGATPENGGPFTSL